MLLEPQFLSRLERLALSTRERLAGVFPGEHRSRRLGSSLDFADWRPYFPGDDFRRIDYQIYARLDRILIRLFEAEEELTVRVVLDASASMGFEDKIVAAARTAGALCYLAAIRRDRARVFVAGPGGLTASPWARSRDSAVHLLGWLENVETGGESGIAGALHRLGGASGIRGLTVVVGDLLTGEWEDVLRRLGGPGAEAGLVHVLGPSELDPDLRGDFLLVDAESAASLDVSVSDQVLRDYKRRVASWTGAVAEACRRRGIRYSLITPADDLEQLMMVRLRIEGLVR